MELQRFTATRLLLLLAVLGNSACSPSSNSSNASSVTATASFYRGIAIPSSLDSIEFLPEKASAQSRALSTGFWYLTPDTVTLTVTSIIFTNGGSSAESVSNTNCTITYNKATGSSLAKLQDCQFSVYPGSYTGISMMISDNVTFSVSDSTNNIYTNPNTSSLLSTTGPAQAITISSCSTCPAGSTTTSSSNFLVPLQVTAGSSPTVSVVFDPVHWISVNADGFGNFSQLATAVIPFVPAASVPSSVQYYSNVGNSAWPASSTSSSQSLYFGSGGYLGIDSGNNMAWAFPTDFTYKTWAQVFTIPKVSVLSGTGLLSYQCTSNVPSPTSGATYSSGEPTLTPTGTRTLALIGQ